MKHFFFVLILPIVSNAQESFSVYFDYNSDYIKNADQVRSDQFRFVQQLPHNTFILKAYTDTVGSLESNITLAKMRLNAVEEQLPSNIDILEVIVVGEDMSNLPDASKRRVDLIFVPAPPEVQQTLVEPEKDEVAIPEVKLGIPLQLKIVFEGGTAIILEESYPQIDELLDILYADSTLIVQLNGHVCCDNDYELSLRRAEAVKNVLISGDINPDRLTTAGFGNTKPLAPDDSEYNMHRNRRVEAVFSREE